MRQWKQKLNLRLPVLIVLVATLLFWGFYDRYERAGSILLESPALSEAVRLQGDCSETNGRFMLSVLPSGKGASIRFALPDAVGYDCIRVRTRMKVDGVVVGDRSWQCARLIFVQYKSENKWISGRHAAVSESGSKGWRVHEEVFEIAPEAVHADLVIQQIGAEGRAEFDSILVEPVRLRRSFQVWRTVFLLLWVCMGLLYFRRCRLHERKMRLLILLNVIAILAGTLLPGVWIERSTDYLKESVAKAFDSDRSRPDLKHFPAKESAPRRPSPPIEPFNDMVDEAHRLGHFILFSSLCFLVYLSAALERPRARFYLKVAFDILLFATITESLQYLTLDRTPGIGDWLLDLGGMVAAFVVFLPISLILKRRA